MVVAEVTVGIVIAVMREQVSCHIVSALYDITAELDNLSFRYLMNIYVKDDLLL
jgi:hypothetical protein